MICMHNYICILDNLISRFLTHMFILEDKYIKYLPCKYLSKYYLNLIAFKLKVYSKVFRRNLITQKINK